MFHGLCLGEEAGAGNLAFFRVKWLQRCGGCGVRRQMWVSHVMLQNALEWLHECCSRISYIVLEWVHQGCDSDLSADFLNFGANNFPFKSSFKKCCKIFFLSVRRRDPVLEMQMETPLRVVLLCFATLSLQITL